MKLTFTVNVEVEKVSGKFVGKDNIAEEIMDELESADPGSITVDESEYEIVSWEVN